VLAVRAGQPTGNQQWSFDLATTEARHLRGGDAEHLLIVRGNELFRLDVIAGTVAAGPVSLRFDIAQDDRLPAQLSTIGRYCHTINPVRRYVQLGNRLLALTAIDAFEAGASLRETADVVLGSGAWPGEGDHRKSRVRRMIVAGKRMIRAGPQPILAGG